MRTLILSLTAIAASAALAGCAKDNSQAIAAAGHLQLLAQRTPYEADTAVAGNLDSFKQLTVERDSATKLLAQLHTSGLDADVAPAWAKFDADLGKVLDAQAAIKGMAEYTSDIDAKLPVFNSRMDEVVKLLAESRDGTKAQVMVASRCMLVLDRVLRRIPFVVNGGEESGSAADGLARDWQYYRVVVSGLENGNSDLGLDKMSNASARAILHDIDAQAQSIDDEVKATIAAATQVQDARQAADASHIDGQTVLLKLEALASGHVR